MIYIHHAAGASLAIHINMDLKREPKVRRHSYSSRHVLLGSRSFKPRLGSTLITNSQSIIYTFVDVLRLMITPIQFQGNFEDVRIER